MPTYFKRRWEEHPGDEHDSWGYSDWYFETDEHGDVLRQVEVYDHGPILRYGSHHPLDEYGGLSDQPIDLGDFDPFAISAEDFQKAWDTGEQRSC